MQPISNFFWPISMIRSNCNCDIDELNKAHMQSHTHAFFFICNLAIIGTIIIPKINICTMCARNVQVFFTNGTSSS